MAAKQAYLHAVAQHRMGLVAQGKKNFGEAVARMEVGLNFQCCMALVQVL